MQNISRRGAPLCAVLLLVVSSVLVGCEDECSKGKTECINSQLIRTCVPTSDEPEWLITECPEHSVCVKDGASSGGTADAGGASSGGAMCVGRCDLGDAECVSDALSQVCIEGGVWQLDACEVGERCVDGTCQVGGGPGSVQACVPDTKQCASDMVEKVCDPDGTAWIQQPCALNEHCVETECVPDSTASCDDGNVCLDAKTAVRCLGQADGFELVPCEGDTYCEFGRCRGSVCAVGSVCSGPFSATTGVASQVRTCADGEGFEDTQCGTNEVCKQDKDWASCVPNVCVPGATVCGDPRDPSVDPTKFFTTCVTAATTASLVPEWAQGECAGNLVCDPTMTGAGTPCRQTCTEGAQRCAPDATLGTSNGVQTCADDGTWLATETCNDGVELFQACMVSPNPDASALPVAVCGEPVCARVFSVAGVAARLQGTCDSDGKLRRCNPDGTLGAPEDCTQGVCANGAVEVAQADGRIAGACQVTPQCQEGDEQCVWTTFGGAPTPYFQTCVNGFWSTQLTACANDGLCYPTKTAENRPAKICGAECSPGTRTCIPDPANVGQTLLATCGADGQFDAGQSCAAGVCSLLGSNDAACVMQCIPGRVSCAGATVTAPDGVHFGTDASALCGDDGLLAAPASCAAGTACRTSRTGAVVGCVECIGPNVPGGNSEGLRDSTCAVAAAAQILECNASNEFVERTCDGTKVCNGPTPPTCGVCDHDANIATASVTCSQTNIVAGQVCGACTVDLDGVGTPSTLGTCTQTAIAAAVGVMGGATTCAGQGYGLPLQWGVSADCCSLATEGYSSCIAAGFGAPTPVSGTADCCSFAVIGGGGDTFAYCAEP